MTDVIQNDNVGEILQSEKALPNRKFIFLNSGLNNQDVSNSCVTMEIVIEHNSETELSNLNLEDLSKGCKTYIDLRNKAEDLGFFIESFKPGTLKYFIDKYGQNGEYFDVDGKEKLFKDLYQSVIFYDSEKKSFHKIDLFVVCSKKPEFLLNFKSFEELKKANDASFAFYIKDINKDAVLFDVAKQLNIMQNVYKNLYFDNNGQQKLQGLIVSRYDQNNAQNNSTKTYKTWLVLTNFSEQDFAKYYTKPEMLNENSSAEGNILSNNVKGKFCLAFKLLSVNEIIQGLTNDNYKFSFVANQIYLPSKKTSLSKNSLVFLSIKDKVKKLYELDVYFNNREPDGVQSFGDNIVNIDLLKAENNNNSSFYVSAGLSQLKEIVAHDVISKYKKVYYDDKSKQELKGSVLVCENDGRYWPQNMHNNALIKTLYYANKENAMQNVFDKCSFVNLVPLADNVDIFSYKTSGPSMKFIIFDQKISQYIDLKCKVSKLEAKEALFMDEKQDIYHIKNLYIFPNKNAKHPFEYSELSSIDKLKTWSNESYGWTCEVNKIEKIANVKDINTASWEKMQKINNGDVWYLGKKTHIEKIVSAIDLSNLSSKDVNFTVGPDYAIKLNLEKLGNDAVYTYISRLNFSTQYVNNNLSLKAEFTYIVGRAINPWQSEHIENKVWNHNFDIKNIRCIKFDKEKKMLFFVNNQDSLFSGSFDIKENLDNQPVFVLALSHVEIADQPLNRYSNILVTTNKKLS